MAMIGDDPYDMAKLETDIDADGRFNPPTKRGSGQDAKTVRATCRQCGGHGCVACGGTGSFRVSERDVRHARPKRPAGKTASVAGLLEDFRAAHPALEPFLVERAKTGHKFSLELLTKLYKYGYLTDGQIEAARNVWRDAKRREAEREAGRREVDLEPIRAMFAKAAESGYRAPVYRAAELVISQASSTGKNPGALYVKTADDEYLGKIIGTSYTGKPAPGLAEIAADPRAAAIAWGQRTGRCSCCGRELTNEGSIDAGIGPVCASKWGL